MRIRFIVFIFIGICIASISFGQSTERDRPEEWEGLINGGRFMDYFLPIPTIGELEYDVWGAEGVKPRYTANGIEDPEWSYWGGNIVIDDNGKYHLFVCRWPEDAAKGHMAWPQSETVHAVADHPLGPFKYQETIGKGHNPEIYQIKDGRYVLYVIGGFYLSSTIEGPWEYHKFEYDQRGRPVFDHLTNFTFAQREDGSYLMVSRGGSIWISESGLPPFYEVSTESVYPRYDGRYEDPVVWRTNIQYHMIVNDWLGRIAYHLRSKDGLHWKVDPGVAYEPGIAKYEDGTEVGWFKFERIKMLQDEYGRAYQANFAVADTLKNEDKGGDKHSAKNIGIPLKKGRLLTVLNTQKIDSKTKTIRLLVKAEEGFNPQRDMDIQSLRFGASEEVNYSRGSKVIDTTVSGDDLIITFDGSGHGLNSNNFAGKLLGKNSKGSLLYGYARLPGIEYQPQAVSSWYPELSVDGNKLKIELEVQNFGQVASDPSKVKIEYKDDEHWMELAEDKIPILQPYQQEVLTLFAQNFSESGTTVQLRVTIVQPDQQQSVLEGPVVVR